ncbi:MAG: glucokinase [Pseudomonadota bacterium]
MNEIAVADIGGTNARFARARRDANGAISLSEPTLLGTGKFVRFTDSWQAFLDSQAEFSPLGAALALAGPANRGTFKLTNANWSFDSAQLPRELGLSDVICLNDFEAISHAIAGLGDEAHLDHLAGPAIPLPQDGTITVIGPGTGLGIAHFRHHDGKALIQATEGSHIDFAPVDEIDDRALTNLRKVYKRVSLERVLSGEGIVHIHASICELAGEQSGDRSALNIWQAGMDDKDPLCQRAVAHFVKTLGRIAGDYALAHGASGVVMAGGVGLRLHQHLKADAFHAHFVAKGRYRAMMEAMPIKLITHPQPGLLGAATAFFAQDV